MDKIVQVGYNWIQDQHMMEAILAAGHIKNTQVLGQIGQIEPKQADQSPGTHKNSQSCQRSLRSNQTKGQTKDQTRPRSTYFSIKLPRNQPDQQTEPNTDKPEIHKQSNHMHNIQTGGLLSSIVQ